MLIRGGEVGRGWIQLFDTNIAASLVVHIYRFGHIPGMGSAAARLEGMDTFIRTLYKSYTTYTQVIAAFGGGSYIVRGMRQTVK